MLAAGAKAALLETAQAAQESTAEARRPSCPNPAKTSYNRAEMNASSKASLRRVLLLVVVGAVGPGAAGWYVSGSDLQSRNYFNALHICKRQQQGST